MPVGGRRRVAGLLAGLLVVAASGCGEDTGSGDETAAASPEPSAAASPRAAPALPLQVALGQLFAVSFAGRIVTPAVRRLILEEKVGTVLVFPNNFSDTADLAQLTGELRSLGRQAGLPAPLLVAVDEEGGEARTVSSGIAPLPAPRSLGMEGPVAVRSTTAAAARGLRRLGIGLDLAPVADLRTNPADAVIGDRSFGADPEVVGPLVAAAVHGLHDGGVGATLKHFPGLGGAAGDPHRQLPTDPVSLSRWRDTQRRSFEQGIEAGADAVMTTAVAVPSLEPSRVPALFSRRVVEDLLRGDLDFRGVVVTDSLSLAAIGARHPLPEAALAAARAGNDLLVLGNTDPGLEDQAIGRVRAALTAGDLPAAQVQRSAARVAALSRRWGA